MKKYRRYEVNFFSTGASVIANNEEEAIEKAKDLYYDGKIACEVESVKIIGDE